MLSMGANITDSGEILFRVFAHNRKKVSLVIKGNKYERVIPMTQEEEHIYSTVLERGEPGLLYKFRLDDEGDFPDPYSQFQPEGVHGFSQVIDHRSYHWEDDSWTGKNLEELIIMEIHVGTFSPEGNFEGIIKRLDYLKELGVNAIELMPVVQTPGRWNWGYDIANLFSVNHNYGTPDDLKRLVDACHQRQMAVILDVVYNHFGPEGNYLPFYGPYLTKKHQTPWGLAVNYDDSFSIFTRKMVLDNVRHWLDTYHIDGLRLDAVHAIKDSSHIHILQEIALVTRNISLEQKRFKFLIAESDENNSRLINPLDKGGYGIDAQWMDDFHHCIHTLLTGENDGYYIDYGRPEDLEKVFKNYLYTGQCSRYWGRKRGTDAFGNPGKQFVVAIQNHDQIGNRALGDRLATLVAFPFLKTAAALMFFSAYVPMIFMGEEYGEKNPFLFFTDYQDTELKKNVSQGRKKEFWRFGWKNTPDPQDPETFYRSKLTPQDQWNEQNWQLLRFYKDLIRLRLSHPVLKKLDKHNLKVKVNSSTRLVEIVRWRENIKLTGLFNLGTQTIPLTRHTGKQIFNSEWRIYGGDQEGETQFLKKGQAVFIES